MAIHLVRRHDPSANGSTFDLLAAKGARVFVVLLLMATFAFSQDYHDIPLYLRHIRLALMVAFPPYLVIQYCFIKLYGRPFRLELSKRAFWALPAEEQVADFLYAGSVMVIGLVAHALGVR
jgi:hypothetical protein